MSIVSKQKEKAASINLDDLPSSSGMPGELRPPRTAPGQLMNLQGKYQQALDDIAQLKVQLEASPARLLDVAELHEVPGRRRKLTDEEYSELKENLRNNDLVQAITVRPRQEGGFEIISGNNRVAIYKELGLPKILAVVQEMTDEHADLAGFYANLLQPSLPDFEKFVGFKRRQLLTNLNQKALAKEAGISESTLSTIFSFDKLPESAKDLLTQNPHVLGAKAASKLGAAVDAGYGERVVEAVRRLVENTEYTQNQAVAYARGRQRAPKDESGEAEPRPLVINSGKKKFCELQARSGKVAITFADPEQAASWLRKFEAFVRAEIKTHNE